MLEDFTVLDLSHRLPGPLSTHVLAELGAKVIKIEDETFGDPFKDGFFKEMDPSFSHWYSSLNAKKSIETYDFKDPSFPEILRDKIRSSDIILNGLPSKLMKKFFEDTFFDTLQGPKAIIKMTGSKKSSGGMHDLNVMARLGLLGLYLKDKTTKKEKVNPPFLPIGGISYGSFLATSALSALLKAQKSKQIVEETFALDDAVEILLSPFYSKDLQKTSQLSFLHNGRYPCYNLYPLKDEGFLAVAALEPKYWGRFCEILNLSLSQEAKFHISDDSVFDAILEKTISMDSFAAKKLFDGQDCCVDIVTSS